jgi:hypothetical protein
VWKGLFEEIVVIANFSLSDSDLYNKIMRDVEEREEYERLIKQFAKEQLHEESIDMSSVSKLSEQSTVVTSKCSSD